MDHEIEKIYNRGVLTFNPGKPEDWHTQIGNERYPQSSCFATGDVNMLLTAGLTEWLKKVPRGMRAPDWITSLFDLPEVDAHARKIGAPPESDRLWYSMHEYVINNIILGGNFVQARYNMALSDIILKIVQRKPPVIGGKFTAQGHMVTACGVETTQLDLLKIDRAEDIDLKAILNIIVDDSYGNYFTRYEDKRGNDVRFPLMIFDELTPKKNCIVLR